jgi:hypothetical protein
MGELVQCTVVPRMEDWVPVMVDPDLPPMPCRAGRLELNHGETIVVDTPDGKFLGRVTTFAMPSFKKPRKSAARIVRRATPICGGGPVSSNSSSTPSRSGFHCRAAKP